MLSIVPELELETGSTHRSKEWELPRYRFSVWLGRGPTVAYEEPVKNNPL